LQTIQYNLGTGAEAFRQRLLTDAQVLGQRLLIGAEAIQQHMITEAGVLQQQLVTGAEAFRQHLLTGAQVFQHLLARGVQGMLSATFRNIIIAILAAMSGFAFLQKIVHIKRERARLRRKSRRERDRFMRMLREQEAAQEQGLVTN
jgi:cell division septum initiation protein DivIVA